MKKFLLVKFIPTTFFLFFTASIPCQANGFINWIADTTHLGTQVFGLPRGLPPRPADWISHRLPVEDTRFPVGHKKRKACDREIIEIPYASNLSRRGTILLIPGFMENVHTWDLVPEKGVSYARWLMNAKGLKVYMLNIRGVGQSCYPSKSNLDDIAIDDIPVAIAAVSQREGKDNFLVMGHSMGGIALQAALAGLDRCGDRNCFDPNSAIRRQKLVDSIAVEGSNSAFNLRDKEVAMKAGAHFEKLLSVLPSFFFDRISPNGIRNLNATIDPILNPTPIGDVLNRLKDPLFYFIFWRYFYDAPNVDPDTREAFKTMAWDATNRGTLEQYTFAIRNVGMQATSGEPYVEALNLITVPFAQAAFEHDTFADWEYSRTFNFDRVGSQEKQYFTYAGEGHQDFMLNAEFHQHQSDLIDWMINAAAAN